MYQMQPKKIIGGYFIIFMSCIAILFAQMHRFDLHDSDEQHTTLLIIHFGLIIVSQIMIAVVYANMKNKPHYAIWLLLALIIHLFAQVGYDQYYSSSLNSVYDNDFFYFTITFDLFALYVAHLGIRVSDNQRMKRIGYFLGFLVLAAVIYPQTALIVFAAAMSMNPVLLWGAIAGSVALCVAWIVFWKRALILPPQDHHKRWFYRGVPLLIAHQLIWYVYITIDVTLAYLI